MNPASSMIGNGKKMSEKYSIDQIIKHLIWMRIGDLTLKIEN